MKHFVRGMLVGVGIGMLVAPMRGEEMRNLLRQRFEEMRGYLPENEQLNQYVQQVSDRVTQTSGTLKDYAQQAVSKVKDTGNTLGDLAQKSTQQVKQASQDVADTTKQTVTSAKQQATKPSSSTTTGTTGTYKG